MFYQSFSDVKLVEFLKKGNTEAIPEIYKRYWQKMFSVAYYSLGNRQEAEEMDQNVL